MLQVRVILNGPLKSAVAANFDSVDWLQLRHRQWESHWIRPVLDQDGQRQNHQPPVLDIRAGQWVVQGLPLRDRAVLRASSSPPRRLPGPRNPDGAVCCTVAAGDRWPQGLGAEGERLHWDSRAMSVTRQL